VGLVETRGDSLIKITLDPAKEVLPILSLQNVARVEVEKAKAKVLGMTRPSSLAGGERALDHFAMEVDAQGRRSLFEYYSFRQPYGGGTVYANLQPRDLSAMRTEVERLARSITITHAIR
jgi:hypothetical protein